MTKSLDWFSLEDPEHDQLLFERGGEFEEELFLDTLEQAIRSLEEAGVRYVLMGGIASAALGRPRWTHDIDLFVKPEESRSALEALEKAGFETQETYPDWLYKGMKKGVLVDLIFRSKGDIYLDDEMLDRAVDGDFKGKHLKLISPEDLLVIKAIVHDEHMARHWHDALGIIASFDLDWPYVLRRAQHGARRILSLLIYAQSRDLLVPNEVIEQLFETIYAPNK